MAEATLDLQRALAEHILAADGARLGAEFEIYRELSRQSLCDPLESTFPVSRRLLEQAGAWDALVEAFLEARCIASPHYRDIAPAFLGWLAEGGQDLYRWPYLLELLHFELVDGMVERWPDEAPVPGLQPEPAPGLRLLLNPATRLLAYGHQVHRATLEAPVPAADPVHLLAFRDAEGDCRLLELTPATAALLVAGQAKPLAEAAAVLGFTDLDGPFALLADLCRQGAVAGFR